MNFQSVHFQKIGAVLTVFGALAAANSFSAAPAQAAARAYIPRCCDSGSSLIHLNTATQVQISRSLLGHSASNPTISADGATAYFLDSATSALLVYDIANNRVSASIYLGIPPGYLFSAISDQMIALTPDGSRAYVALASIYGGLVAVVDLIHNAVITRVPVSIFPTSAVVLSKDGQTVYAPSQDICADDCIPGSVSVISTATNTVISQMYSDYGSSSAVLSPDGSRLYVANSNTIAYYDTASNTYISSISVPAASGLAIKHDGSQVYFAEAGSPAVGVIDTQTGTVVSTISLLKGAGNIAITPDGTEAYVLDGSGGISVLNTSTNTLLNTVTLPEAADGIAFLPSGTSALLTDAQPSTLALANERSAKTTGIIFGPANPGPVALTADQKTLYVAGSGGLGVIDIATETQVGFIPVPYQIQAVSLSADGSRALLGVFDSNVFEAISGVVVDLAAGQTLATITNEGFGFSAAISADGLTGYIGDYSTLIVIDLTNFQIVNKVQFASGKSVEGLLLSGDGSRLFASVAVSGTLSVYSTKPFRSVTSFTTGASTETPIQMALTADGKTLLIPDHNGSQLLFVDLLSRQVTNKVPVSGSPLAVAISPDGTEAWTAAQYTNLSKTVTIVNIASHQAVSTVNIGGTASGIVFVP